MPNKSIAPYGSWRSPITAELVSTAGVRLSSVSTDGDDVYWLEGRPTEGGRSVLVVRRSDGTIEDVTPEGFNVRTTVHEYGGGAYIVQDGIAYFSNFSDQRLYRQAAGDAPGPITPDTNSNVRFSDGRVTTDGSAMYCVRESHPENGDEAVNEIVRLLLDGSGDQTVIATGRDFYAAPRLSPDERRISWLTWDHPNMPWDTSFLEVAELGTDGQVSVPKVVVGRDDVSIYQPEWGPDGRLYFVSDESGWWNLNVLGDDGDPVPLAPMEAEFGHPMWGLGASTYGFMPDGRILATWSRDAIARMGVVDPNGGELTPLNIPFTSLGASYGNVAILNSGEDPQAVALGGSSSSGAAVVSIDLSDGWVEVLKRGSTASVDPGYLSEAEPISVPVGDGQTSYVIWYPPKNADHDGPSGEKPPLVVISHGGPTSQTDGSLSMGIQFWTSRGIGVVDVNYRGSSGYGRAYRDALQGTWGLADAEDCIAAARYLVDKGLVDGSRLTIRGGSAGGYTTLVALAFHDEFAAGASYYGVADLTALAEDTHKFESHYLDGLIAPYPEGKAVYDERSAIKHVDGLSAPLILFQGLEDKVVPPEQARMMADALRTREIPFALLEFDGEQHGFRKAGNAIRSLEAELYFYGRILGFEPADEIEPVVIEGLR
ncbi:MAG: S9 family peptidase [Chloroflexi bacterium]|jgi:dipeptidyl aminopeptidase/acylaminoacyl peptidase|nr:S9 family peptidase [Chloroflexota bacterium]MBT4074863.1 S9 family peptidase [Chloroflexota bacterium]MBT4513890.1 S9 family peptidase [Chloroflexota bacterium]MBT6680484.1 S9 family peptidase [Chloroflexota bacterium]